MTVSSIVREIWSMKWWIAIGSLALFIAMASAISFYRPLNSVSIIFNRLPVSSNSNFLDLNAALDALILPLEKETPAKLANLYNIDSDLLFSSFLEILSRKRHFKEIMQSKVVEEYPSLSDEEIEKITLGRIRDMKLLPPATHTKWGNRLEKTALEMHTQGWELVTQSKTPEIWVSGILDVFARAGELTKANAKKDIEALLANARLSAQFSLLDLERKRKEAVEDYDVELARQVAQLSEYAKIARSLDISSNTIATIPVGNSPTFVTSINEESPPYFLGYKALEEQISLMTNRTEKNLFVDNISEINENIREIKGDKKIDRADKLLKQSDINDSDFEVAMYGKEKISISKVIGKIVLLPIAAILSIILAVGFSIFIVAVRWFDFEMKSTSA